MRSPCAHGANHIGADGGGNQANLDFAQAKACGIHSHCHIAAGHQPHAAGIHIALHPRNGGLGAFVDDAKHLSQQACIHAVLVAGVIGHAAHPVQIGTCAESRAFSGQHDGAHIRAVTGVAKGGSQLGNHFIAEGVANLGLGQRDAGNAATHGQSQSSHDWSPFMPCVSCSAPGVWAFRKSCTSDSQKLMLEVLSK